MRIITADDSKITGQVMRQIVESVGHEHVAHARSGQEAIDLCRKHKPDLVCLDIIMPPMNGDEAAKIIQDEGLAKRILFISSNSQQAVKNTAKRFNAGFVTKPYQPDKVKAAIEVIHESLRGCADGFGDADQLLAE